MLPQDPAGAYQLCPHEEGTVTLEVKFEIIPFGIRANRHTIHTVKIDRTAEHADGRDYDYEILEYNDMIPKGEAGHVLVVGRGEVKGHRSGDRALELVRRVLENYLLGV